jgi:diguanylate cyclase (GGDEF)-like protein
MEDRDGAVAYWLPLSERGQLRGVISVNGVDADRELDRQTLITIGAEFGVAYENQRRFEEARALADRDPMTGLFNPRYLHTALDELTGASEQQGEEFALVLLDIDDFKLFNDTYGHQAGDEVLTIVAAGLREHCEAGAFGARFGGDEFAVVLPKCGRTAAIDFIKRLQEWADNQAFQQEGGERIPIRLSFGLGVFPEHGTKRYEIVSAADASLYDAKRSGSSLVTRVADERRDALLKSGTFTFLEALVTSVDNKDQYTKRHCDLVSEYALVVAEGMSLSDEIKRSLVIAGALHDVGKICIPDRILRKPSGLTPEEYETIKLHVPLAANLIQHVPRRKDVLDGVLNHHERFDGSGYMKGLKGMEIPLLGRIMSIADAFSAMTLDRPYRKALPFDHALQEILKGSNSQFDPELVEVFIAEMERRFGGIQRAA